MHCNEPPGSSVLNIVHEYCLGPNTSVIRNNIALAQSSSMQLDSSSNVDDMDRLNNMLHGSSSDRVENGNDDSTSGSENESSPDAQESSGKRCDRQSRSSVVFNRTTAKQSNFVDSLDPDDYEVVANSLSKKRKIKKSSQTSADSDDELFDDDLATSTATSSGNATKGARKKKIIDSDDE